MVKVSEICDAIAEVLSEASGIKSVKSYNEVTEGVPAVECPRLQVYPDDYNPDINNTVERTTFGGVIRQAQLNVFVDIFARERSHINLDMEALVDTLDSLIDVLEDQEDPPFFGLEGIKAFGWTWKRVGLIYGGHQYLGGRIILRLRLF